MPQWLEGDGMDSGALSFVMSAYESEGSTVEFLVLNHPYHGNRDRRLTPIQLSG